jgi:hypothetical protein
MERGIAPGGILVGSSWTLIFWKSAKVHLDIYSSHEFLSQFSVVHFFGSVYLNCCTISLLILPQVLHLKMPILSSGLTSEVLVTVPLSFISLPRYWHFNPLTLSLSPSS